MDVRERYQHYLKEKNLRCSSRRDLIFEHILNMCQHFTIDELYHQIAMSDPEIGIATVYRTINLLIDAGVLVEHQFGDKRGVFEVISHSSDWHGHLICQKCGAIIEMKLPAFQEIEKQIQKQHNFEVKNLKFEIYGICNKCKSKRFE